MILLYQLFLILYKAGVYFVSFWNDKARLWIKGRINVFQKLKKSLAGNTKKTVWMHCASLGEFEQGRPVLQKIKESYPGVNIVITFFSPSGYEIVKRNKEFDKIFYMPMDSFIHAKRWLKIMKPDLVLWVKYEYWFYYLQEINRKKIPLLLISGVFNPNQVFFKWYGGLYRQMLSYFSHFFLQNESSKEQLNTLIGEDKITVSGDTRCDRVIQIAENFVSIKGIAEFCGDSPVVVAGSTWEDDEAMWIHYANIHPEIKFIIAPHEVDEENINDIQNGFKHSILYSNWVEENRYQVSGIRSQESSIAKQVASSKKEEENNREQEAESRNEGHEPIPNCLIIDNVGMLSKLYHYATITYVGGGFGDDGLHNILEAAVFGKPVIFGPAHYKNFEAQELINCSGALCIESAVELERVVNDLLENKIDLAFRGKAARDYIYQNAGASEKIISFINGKSLLGVKP